MDNILLFDVRNPAKRLRAIPNILSHRVENMKRVELGEAPIDFWATVPKLLELAEEQSKKEKISLYVLKEKVELILTVAAVKGVRYGY